MQLNTNNIQRPTLFSEFFTEEILWNNEFLSYIETGLKNVTSTIHKTANTLANNITFSQNKKYSRDVDNLYKRVCNIFQDYESNAFIWVKSVLFISYRSSPAIQYYNDYENFSIFNPLPHNNALSLV